jgi:hypothetical protein
MRTVTAYIERDQESKLYIGIVPGVTGAHTREARIDSVKRHREWQKHLDNKQFFGDVFTA